jgi:hypothetical protein
VHHTQCEVLRKADELFFAVQDDWQGDVNVLEGIELASLCMYDMPRKAQLIIGMLYDILYGSGSRAQ